MCPNYVQLFITLKRNFLLLTSNVPFCPFSSRISLFSYWKPFPWGISSSLPRTFHDLSLREPVVTSSPEREGAHPQQTRDCPQQQQRTWHRDVETLSHVIETLSHWDSCLYEMILFHFNLIRVDPQSVMGNGDADEIYHCHIYTFLPRRLGISVVLELQKSNE